MKNYKFIKTGEKEYMVLKNGLTICMVCKLENFWKAIDNEGKDILFCTTNSRKKTTETAIAIIERRVINK